jgi:hypothetical protein
MSDILRKIVKPVVSSVTFDPVVYRAEPGRCITYQFSSGSSTMADDVPTEDLRAIEFSLKQVLNNVVRPEIEKRVKQQKIDSYKK